MKHSISRSFIERVIPLFFIATCLNGCFPEPSNQLNFAFGGAKTDDTNLTGSVVPQIEALVTAADLKLIGLEQQLTFARDSVKDVNPEKSLFWIWIGTNDYIGGQTEANVVPSRIVEVMTELKSRFGAKHFVVPNLMALGDLPKVRASGPSAVAAMNTVVVQSNENLASAIAAFKSSNNGVTVAEVDVHGLFLTLKGNAQFTNTTDDCLRDGKPKGADCNTWVYFDDIHFTSPVAQLVAQKAVTQLEAIHGAKLKEFERMITFGDSLSDTGSFNNTLTQSIGFGLGMYYKGRFSNGPNTIDHLERLLKIKFPSNAYRQRKGALSEAVVTQG